MTNSDACPECDGAGHEWPAGSSFYNPDKHCPSCGGTGEVPTFNPSRLEPCPSCGGMSDRPAVTDAEVRAARNGIVKSGHYATFTDAALRAALEAAARVRGEMRRR